MAVTAGCIFEVRSTGSDSACSGGFDPSQTAGMFTDGAATSATGNSPVFSSASYNFVAGDVGAWVYIASGTNWTPGWYEIASVASNVATLKAAVGEAVGKKPGFAPNTVAGCATTGSPTGATWTIDYSQQAAAKYTFSDLTYVSGTTFTSATVGFGKQLVGNVIRIDSGTNFTVGYFVITSVSGTTATLNATACSGASSNGAGCIGGAFANPGQPCAKAMIAANTLFIKGNTTYTVTTYNYTGGGACLPKLPNQGGGGPLTRMRGYNTIRGDAPTISQIPLIYSDSTSMTFGDAVVNIQGGVAEYIYAKSNNVVSTHCITGNNNGECHFCKVEEGRYYGFTWLSLVADCYVLNCGRAGAVGISAVVHTQRTVVVPPTTSIDGITPTNGGSVEDCLVIGGRNALAPTSYGVVARHNTFYNQSGDAVKGNANDGYGSFHYERNLVVNSGGYAFSGSQTNATFRGNAYYNCTSGLRPSGMGIDILPNIALTGDPFTSTAGSDYSLNNTSGAGAGCRGISQAFFGLSTTTDYSDIGAVQHQDSGGGSSSILCQRGMNGGFPR